MIAILAVVSLVLAVLVGMGWFYSRQHLDCLYYTKQRSTPSPKNWYGQSTSWGVLSFDGRLQLDWLENGQVRRSGEWTTPNGRQVEFPRNAGAWSFGDVALYPAGSEFFIGLDAFVEDMGGGTAFPRTARQSVLGIGFGHQIGIYPGFVMPGTQPARQFWFATIPDFYFVLLFSILPASVVIVRHARRLRGGGVLFEVRL